MGRNQNNQIMDKKENNCQIGIKLTQSASVETCFWITSAQGNQHTGTYLEKKNSQKESWYVPNKYSRIRRIRRMWIRIIKHQHNYFTITYTSYLLNKKKSKMFQLFRKIRKIRQSLILHATQIDWNHGCTGESVCWIVYSSISLPRVFQS